jgi:hypothetical protein
MPFSTLQWWLVISYTCKQTTLSSLLFKNTSAYFGMASVAKKKVYNLSLKSYTTQALLQSFFTAVIKNTT